MVKKIKIYFRTIVSFSLLLFLMTNCSPKSEGMSMMANLKTLMEILEDEDSSNEDEEKEYVDVSGINKDLYGILSYKEKINPFDSLDNKSHSQINFSVDEKENKWKPIPDSGKIEIKSKESPLLFSLKGAVRIGEIDSAKIKKSEKISLSSLLTEEKERKNFKYLVLSLSSKKTGKLEIKDSDIEKLKDKLVDFKKEPEDFVKDPAIEKALEGKKKATQKEIFGYDVDENILIKKIKKKLNEIVESQIKELDSITESVSVYASDTEPKFNSKSYTINELDDVNLTYLEDSINQDDLQGSLSYEVELSVSRIEEKRKIKVSYSGFKSTSARQTKLNSIYKWDIKRIDGIVPSINRYPSDYSEPKFDSNPYTLKGLSDVTVTYVEGSKRTDDMQSRYSYEVELSAGPKLNKKRMTILYERLFWNRQIFRDLFAEAILFRSIAASHIKALDGITPNENVFPSTLSNPNFKVGPYTFDNLPKEWIYGLTKLEGVTIIYVKDSMKKLDNEGTFSYEVELSFPKLKKRTLSIIYREDFKAYISQKSWKNKKTYAIEFSSDGSKLVSVSDNKEGAIWDVSTGSVLRKMDKGSACSVDISPDDKYIVTTQCNNNHQVRYLDFSTGDFIDAMTAHAGYDNLDALMAPVFSPDGTKISAGIWSYHVGSRLLPPVVIFDFQLALTHSADNFVSPLDLIFQKLNVKVKSDHRINTVKFSSDSKKLFVASNDKKITIWDVNTGSLLNTITTPYPPLGLDISPDGTKIISGQNTSVGSWNASTGAFLKSYSSLKSSFSQPFNFSPRFSTDGKKIVATLFRNQIMIWDVDDNSAPSKILVDYGSSHINELEISPDGTKIITASYSNMKVWEDTRAGKTILDK